MFGWWLAVGCATYDSVDDACRDRVPGEGQASPAATEVAGRIGCYRRYVGLDGANLVGRITDAVVAHVDYLERHEQVAGDWQSETPDTPGFTGADAIERLYASEYLVPDVGTAFVWEVLLPLSTEDEMGRAEMIDAYMHDPFLRDVFLAPGWEGAGYAEGSDPAFGPFAYTNVVLYFPSGARSQRPVVYPGDGQADVPTSWALADRPPDDPWAPGLEGLEDRVGYPISLTFGSNTIGADASNPLRVRVVHSEIIGPDGPVAHRVVLPGIYAAGVNRSTAVLVPEAPLAPAATYTWEAVVSWIDRPDGRIEGGSFTTHDGGSPPPVAR
jgi:hypothetical protein